MITPQDPLTESPVSQFTSMIQRRAILWQLLPGMVASGLLYFVISISALSVGWGVLLLLQGWARQDVLGLTLSPGTVMALEPPVQLAVTAAGVVASVMYVRRRQDADPAVALVPARRT
jgi:hypothetical protein